MKIEGLNLRLDFDNFKKYLSLPLWVDMSLKMRESD
jgi:hypothetical protein